MSSKWDPSKWELHLLYSKHPMLRKHTPPTSRLTVDSLSKYLDKYDAVYIKGMNQHTGSGIIKVWRRKKKYRFVKVRGKAIEVTSIRRLYDTVKDNRPSKSILVQKAVDLASIRGRPFSIRLQVMRDGKGEWQYAGMMAKVSGKGSIVSNIRRGKGYATTIDDALVQSLGYSPEKVERVKRMLIRIGYDIVHHATDSGYKSHESGLDLGIDRNGKIWIIEVNLAYPSYKVFDRLEDKTFYNKIKSLADDYKVYEKSK